MGFISSRDALTEVIQYLSTADLLSYFLAQPRTNLNTYLSALHQAIEQRYKQRRRELRLPPAKVSTLNFLTLRYLHYCFETFDWVTKEFVVYSQLDSELDLIFCYPPTALTSLSDQDYLDFYRYLLAELISLRAKLEEKSSLEWMTGLRAQVDLRELASEWMDSFLQPGLISMAFTRPGTSEAEIKILNDFFASEVLQNYTNGYISVQTNWELLPLMQEKYVKLQLSTLALLPEPCFKQLRALELIGVGLTSLPIVFERLPNLITLNLSHNELQSFPTWNVLRNLAVLNLAYNRFSGFPFYLLNYPMLHELILDNNPLGDELTFFAAEGPNNWLHTLSHFGDQHLNGLSSFILPVQRKTNGTAGHNLRILSLSNCQLTTYPRYLDWPLTAFLPKEVISILVSRGLEVMRTRIFVLTTLNLSFNYLTKVNFHLLQVIESYNFSHNRITEVTYSEAPGTWSLATLNFSYNRLKQLPTFSPHVKVKLGFNPLS